MHDQIITESGFEIETEIQYEHIVMQSDFATSVAVYFSARLDHIK